MVLVEIFDKNPSLRGTKILLCGCGLKFLKQDIISHHIFFRLDILNGSAKSPAVNLSRLNSLRGIMTSTLTPERCDKHPLSSYMGVSAGLFCRA